MICPLLAPADPDFGIGPYADWVALYGQPRYPG